MKRSIFVLLPVGPALQPVDSPPLKLLFPVGPALQPADSPPLKLLLPVGPAAQDNCLKQKLLILNEHYLTVLNTLLPLGFPFGGGL